MTRAYRSLNSSAQLVRTQAAQEPKERTRRAFLVMPYRDKTQRVLVQFSDPRLGSRGAVVQARIAPGVWDLTTTAPNLDIGYPVTVVIRRGRVEVVGF